MRRHAILGVLADQGSCTAVWLASTLGYPPLLSGLIERELKLLEENGHIDSSWSGDEPPRRRLYRLSGTKLPSWVYAFVSAVDQYEDEHPKQEDCLGRELTAMVPNDVRHHARRITVSRREESDDR